MNDKGPSGGAAGPEEGFRVERDDRGVVRLILDRPAVRNAFDDFLIGKLTNLFNELSGDFNVRVVILAAAGRHFSAGADLNWMRRLGTYGPEENLRDANALGDMFHALDTLPHPVIAEVQGAALAGATGLVACADIAIAADNALFGTTETRLGIVPGAISPYVMRAIGPRECRRWFLSGERMDAATALRLGLVHEVVAPDGLGARVDEVVHALLSCGPNAVRAAKRLVADLAGRPLDAGLRAESARRISEIRATPEAQEGLAAFLEKRPPDWVKTG